MDEQSVHRAIQAVVVKAPGSRRLLMDIEDHLLNRTPYSIERESHLSFQLGFQLSHHVDTEAVVKLVALINLRCDEERPNTLSAGEKEFGRSAIPTEWERLSTAESE
jgi:hypothetical protein